MGKEPPPDIINFFIKGFYLDYKLFEISFDIKNDLE